MKNLICLLFISINILFGQNSTDSIVQLNEVNATFQATKLSPVNYQNISSIEINKKSTGQEPAILLSITPSITYSTDGGHFQGYSYFRIRGIDQTRVNITLDGVPLNDPADQAFYFANFTDILNSIDKIQIQRGVGITKNGNASYAGSIELFSRALNKPQKIEFGLGYGSYNTFRSYVSYNSGINNKKALYLRLSKIESDGFKQHSANNSQSIFLSGGLFLNKSIWKFNILGGKQKNELAWMAVPEIDIQCDRTINSNSEYERDDFSQFITHIQNTYSINNNNTIKSSIYYTLADGWWIFDLNNYYNILSDGINLTKNDINSNLIGFFSNYELIKNNIKFNTGFHGNIYNNQFTEIDANSSLIYYTANRLKNEISTFNKIELKINKLLFSSDVQLRRATFNYQSVLMKFNTITWNFINPKFGISYQLANNKVIYSTIGRNGREPAKYDMFQGNDLLIYLCDSDDNWNPVNIPEYGNDLIYSKKAEYVNDLEIGLRKNSKTGSININYFYMDFENERVLNGAFGPNGLALRTSVDNSMRTGLEFSGEFKAMKNIIFTNNSSYNYSIIKQDNIEFKPILTPKIIINQEISYSLKNFTFSIATRYQSNSYINFENSESIDDYFILNGRIDYTIKKYYMSLFLNNITDTYYFNNGIVNSDGTNSYFVQAPRNIYFSIKKTF